MSQSDQHRASPDPFGSDVPTDDLRARSVRGGTHATAAQVARFGIQMLGLVVLARLLDPEDFGLLAMVAAVTGFLGMFKDAGLPAATIERDTIRNEEISALFWINASLGVLLAGAVAALSGPLAWFYGDERLGTLALVLGVGFVFQGLEVQHEALLKRRMRVSVVAWSRTAAQVVGTAAAIAAAWAGWGYWALAVRGLIAGFLSMVLLWIAMPWAPLPPWKARGAHSFVRFGGYLTAFNAVNHVGRNIDDILIGRFFGGAALGLYSKAYALLLMPVRMINTPISNVAIPALSRLRSEPRRLRSYYYKALSMVVALSMPIVACLAALTDPFVAVVLGERWTEVGSIFRILALTAFIGTFNVATGWVFVTLGKVREQLISGTLNSCGVVLSVFVGVQYGIEGVGWALLVCALCQRGPTIAYCYRGTPFTLQGLAGVLWRPAAASVIAGVGTHGFAVWIGLSMGPAVVLLLSLPVFAALYVCSLLGLPGGQALVSEVLGHLRLLRNQPDEVPA